MDDLKLSELGFNWDEVLAMLKTTGVDFAINLFTALVIFVVGRFVARLMTGGLRRLMEKRDTDPTLVSFVSNLVGAALLAFVIIAAIGALGVQTASLIAVLGAAGLAVGLALQGSLSNFAAGVLIVLFRPYKVGDWVEAAGVSGAVAEVQILTTALTTADNKLIIVPNSQIMSSIITNYSANDTRRVEIVVGVSYDDDIDKVRSTLEELIRAEDRVLEDPAHMIAVSELADSSVNFVVRPWVRTSDYWGVTFDLTEAIKKRFDKEGISIPFPQQDVHLYKTAE